MDEQLFLIVREYENQIQCYSRYNPNFKYNIDSIYDTKQILEGNDALKYIFNELFQYIKRWVLMWFLKEYKTCIICRGDEFNYNQMMHLPCGHFCCRDCMRQTYESQIDDGKLQFKCIYPNCNQLLNSMHLQLLGVNNTLLLRKNIAIRKLMQIPSFNRVPCKTENCYGMIIRAEQTVAIQPCRLCRNNGIDSWYCFKCSKYHNLEKCNSILNKSKMLWKSIFGGTTENETEKMILKSGLEMHRCPNCKTMAAKNELCNHVTCYECGFEYNWKYERKWMGNNAEYELGTMN